MVCHVLSGKIQAASDMTIITLSWGFVNRISVVAHRLVALIRELACDVYGSMACPARLVACILSG